MTEANKDDFRRTVAQIDGLVREANPLIQMMENSPIPGNAQDLGTINTLHREVRNMITEVKNNARQIQEFMSRMNLMGTGAAPGAPGTSPAAPQSSVGAQPWTNPQVTAAIDEYLRSNNLNQWGYPETPGVRQGVPPQAVGKNRYQFLWENPSVRAAAQKAMSGS